MNCPTEEKRSPLHIGMRTLKTTLAVLLCLIIYHFSGHFGSFLACVSAIICMQDCIDKSIQSGLHRIAGTAIGAALGMAFLYLLRLIANPYLVIALTAFGVLGVIFFCNLLKIENAIIIACTVFFVIVQQHGEGSPLVYSIYRLLDTTLGIIIAILINRFIGNPDRRKKKKQEAKAEIEAEAKAETEGTPQTANAG